MFGECAQANILTAQKEISERNQTNIITQYYILQPILQYGHFSAKKGGFWVKNPPGGQTRIFFKNPLGTFF